MIESNSGIIICLIMDKNINVVNFIPHYSVKELIIHDSSIEKNDITQELKFMN